MNHQERIGATPKYFLINPSSLDIVIQRKKYLLSRNRERGENKRFSPRLITDWDLA